MPLPRIDRIETPRLVLRPVSAADLPDLMAVNGDDEVTRFVPYATWQSLDDAQAWLGRIETLVAGGGAHQLVVQQRSDGRAIGGVLLFKHDDASRRIELGYVLGRAHWGQGLMREAVHAACSHAFGPMGLRRIEAEVNPANTASCGLLHGLGFTLEGTARQRWTAKGQTYDTQLFGCLAHEWQADMPSAR